jgi:hypothetical protein
VEHSSVPLEDALANLRALEDKLRGQLEKDKARMNMLSHDPNSTSKQSTWPESKLPQSNRIDPAASSKLLLS